MELLAQFLDLVLHLDKHLALLIQQYGAWIYAILFLIIFCETGLVVTPFLPGDSLLFVAGTMAAVGAMDVHALFALLVIAAFSGDNTNYWIGHYIGPKVFKRERSILLNPEHLRHTQRFYEKHGGKTVVLARFMPIVRTFAPFVAGIGRMRYTSFMFYSFSGSVLWIGFFVYCGYYFGNIPFVKNNLTAFILGVIVLSIMPAIVTYLKSRFGTTRS
ncbi:MAG: associated golgi family protein [Rhodocyclales bacterium]|nr:associated golgi family protein [Rhodocyclales bacterium]